MEKFLYLTEQEWQHAWVHGGSVPIKLASTYLNGARNGIYTPDETVIHDSPVDLRSLEPFARVRHSKGITMFGNTINGIKTPEFENASFYREDGIILSFCHVARREIQERLQKACCVKILDIAALKESIDAQLGVVGRMGACQYTAGHQRNHFLKSMDDLWQQEYRMFWLGNENKNVILPPGIAVPVEL